MALHTELPIYKAAEGLCGLSIRCLRHLPRDVRPIHGRKFAEEALELCTLVLRANVARDKAPHLDALIERAETVALLCRLFHAHQLLSPKQYAAAIALTGSIGRQATGWRRQSASSPVASPPRP